MSEQQDAFQLSSHPARSSTNFNAMTVLEMHTRVFLACDAHVRKRPPPPQPPSRATTLPHPHPSLYEQRYTYALYQTQQPKGINYRITAHNMQESGQCDTQLHKNNLYLQTDICTLRNTKPVDTETEVSVQTDQSDTKRQVGRDLMSSISLH